MSWFYNLLVGLGGMVIGALAFADEIGNKIRYFGKLKSLVFKIPIFLLGSFGIIMGTYLKDQEDEAAQQSKDEKNVTSLHTRDSLHQVKYREQDSLNRVEMKEILDSSYIKSITASNEALAKYNLRFIDSLHSVASTINTKTSQAQLIITPIENGVTPVFFSSEQGKRWLNVRFNSSLGTSYNVTARTYILNMRERGDRFVVQHENDLDESLPLVPGVDRTHKTELNPNTFNLDSVIVVVLTSFTRAAKDGTPIYDRYAFEVDIKNSRYIGPARIYFEELFRMFDKLKIPH